MSTQVDPAPQAEQAARRRMSARTALLIACTAALTIFAVQNLQPAQVWPLGEKPVIVVILISFVLGGLSGWLVKSMAASRSGLRGRD